MLRSNFQFAALTKAGLCYPAQGRVTLGDANVSQGVPTHVLLIERDWYPNEASRNTTTFAWCTLDMITR